VLVRLVDSTIERGIDSTVPQAGMTLLTVFSGALAVILLHNHISLLH
jgi:hypothetical protein